MNKVIYDNQEYWALIFCYAIMLDFQSHIITVTVFLQ